MIQGVGFLDLGIRFISVKTPVREAIHLHKLTKPIPGSAEDDQREIDEVDQIRMCAVDAIRSFLGLL
jgi:hypothetical protein